MIFQLARRETASEIRFSSYFYEASRKLLKKKKNTKAKEKKRKELMTGTAINDFIIY